LLGLYGDSLLRKFGEEPPPEWAASIGELNDYQLARGMRRLKYSGKPHAPSLPEFLKLCRTIGHADDIADERPRPTVPLIAHDENFDKWGVAANFRLLSYVLRQGERRRYFDPPQTRILVALKNRWADLMRESGGDEDPTLADQQAAWDECIRMAEVEISRAKAA
jgi:hypothetical protein